MKASFVAEPFEERVQEIDAYLDLLDALDRQVKEGPPKIGGTTITTQQQRILYSSVYLQLYNLVEATASWCVDAVCAAAADGGRWQPSDLAGPLRREWIRATARTHTELNPSHRLESAVAVCDHFVQALPVKLWELEKGGGGNWDDCEFEEITSRLGFDLQISAEVYTAIKRKLRNDKSALVLIKKFRNDLAHGSISFVECGDGVTPSDLRDIKERTALYLREVVAAFQTYIESYEFLVPERRPAPDFSI